MRFRTLFAAALCAGIGLAAAAAGDRIEGPSPRSRAALDLYDAPAVDAARRSVPVARFVFPLPVAETDAGFHRIDFEGRAYWVRAMNVQLRRAADGGCVASSQTRPGPTGSTPGAAADRCGGN